MSGSHRGIPCQVGSLSRQPALRLAEMAIAIAGERSGSARYAVTIDPVGLVWLDWVAAATTNEMVATITRKSDPDWLGSELAHEWKQRAGAPKRHVVRSARVAGA